ncbi:MAG: hypothetical protein Q8N54_04795 [Sulfurimicrobium sp.]|jgi:hypothetical protein|nr:hypothetical protein [Sulfurimicrobium sp.]MDZ7656958.1 hypothetical protein [Sulfurimicrobium sp.]
MTTKIIACVTTQGAIGSLFEHGKLGPCRQFPATESGQRDFGELLHAHPTAPVYLMIDSVEEDYHAELLPHVSGSARHELLQRKLKQLYRNTPYCTAWIQGRDSGKRRDDRYLFAALINADMLRPWLDVLHRHQAPLAGIFLLPMVSQELLFLLKLTHPDVLLVSMHHDGLRQSFFQGGQLKTSRLAVFGSENVATASLIAEIGKTRLYLNSLRLAARESALAVLLLDPDDAMEEMQQCLQADPTYACQRLTQRELSAHLKGLSPGSCPYSTHMAVLGLRHPEHNLAPASETRSHWRHQQRRTLYGASAVAAAVSLIWAGTNLFQQYQLDGEARHLAGQTQEQLARYVEVTKTFPQTPVSADHLEKAVQIADRLKQDGRTPERMMQIVSRVLETSPDIALTRFAWKYGVPGENSDKVHAATPSAGGARWAEWGVIEAEVRPFHGDYRAAMAGIKRFADKLKHDPDVASASVTQMPLNVHSTSALSGNTLDTASTDSVRAEFKLQLVLRARQ